MNQLNSCFHDRFLLLQCRSPVLLQVTDTDTDTDTDSWVDIITFSSGLVLEFGNFYSNNNRIMTVYVEPFLETSQKKTLDRLGKYSLTITGYGQCALAAHAILQQ